MRKRKNFPLSSSVVLFLVGLFLHAVFTITPINGSRHFVNDDPFTTKQSESGESEEEKCERLPPKYSNASGSLQYKKFDMVSLLKYGTDLIDQNKYVDKTILILGNTGSGKTTISQILSGNLDSLHAVVTQSDRMVIIDDHFKISGPSTTSKTLIPELVIVEAKGEHVDNNRTSNDDDAGDRRTTFYDCPGFDDTRGPDEDLAANFFMNHVVRRKVNKVKMLFLVIHSSIKLGNDRLDFDLLANHAIKFVQNLPKYENSIGLVVTKVGNYNARRKYIRDKTILREIVEFLELYNNDMRIKLTSGKITPEERNVINKKIKFVEILLQRNKNGVYTKIAFSRDPEKCGPLSKSLAVAQTRKRLQNLYENELKYRSANFSDFGYTLKDSTSLNIRYISQNINKDIASAIRKVTSQFENWAEKEKLTETKNYTEILSFVENSRLELSKLVSSLESYSYSSVNVVEISNLFKASLRKLGYHVSSQVDQFMERQQAYIEFFEADDISKILETWAESIKTLHGDFVGLEAWYTFCQDVENKVALYSFQGRKESMDNYTGNRNISTLLRFLEVEAKLLVPLVVKDFSVNFEEKGKIGYFGKRLFDIVDFAMKSTDVNCTTDGTVYVTGNFVKISEFADKLNGDSICSINSKRVEVYASHTVFIDADISAEGRELNVVIVAPKWSVIGQREFNLQGSSPPPIIPPKAKSGRHGFGESGESGEPGLPGGPGGSMFGVAGKVEADSNGGSLYVNCDGGNGGPGQDAGDGGNGSDGRATAYGSNFVETREVNFAYIYLRDRKVYDGYSGHTGGNGGLGGYGGDPGLPGKFNLEILETSSAPSTNEIIRGSKKRGEEGEKGKPGQGGEGGKPGDALSCYESHVLAVFPWSSGCETVSPRKPKGESGFSFFNMFNGEAASTAKRPEYSILKWKSILHYKINFFDCCSQKQNTPIQKLLDLIDMKPYITDIGGMGDRKSQLYTFVGEFLFLEQTLVSSSVDSEIISLYVTFIKRLESYFKVFLKGGLYAEERKFCKLLLAAASSKLISVKQGSNGLGYVVDIRGYLGNVKQQLGRYSPRNVTESLIEVLKRYEMHLHKKVENFADFVSNGITPSIAKAGMDQYHRLKALERKFTELVNSTEEVNWEYSKWQLKRGTDTHETLQVKQAYDVVPITMHVISLLGGEELLDLLTNQIVVATNSSGFGLEELLLQISKLSQSQNSLLFASNRTSKSSAKEFFGEWIATDLYDSFAEDGEKISRLENLTEEVGTLVLDVHERRIVAVESLLSFLKSVEEYAYLQRFKDDGDLWDTVQEWQVKAHVHNVKQTLMTLIDGMDSKVYLNLFDRIQDALTMLIDYYDNVEQYQNIKRLAIYMVNTTNNLKFWDSRFNLEAPQLLNVLEHNILNREYQKALHAFRQSVFPFGKLYESEKAPPKNSFAQAQTFYVKQIESLEAEVVDRVKTRNGTYGVTRQMDFYRKPFFVWENSKWSGEIADLLAGKKVQLKADIRQAVDIPDAVKFHLVELNFKVKSGIGGGLRKHLENLRVTMTHSGTSYYRLNNKFYVMTGKNITIRYNFETEGLGSGEELVENGHVDNEAEGDVVYEKMFQMSPYTLWTVQLEKVESENGTSTADFGELQRWAKVVDVELVGKGVYVEKGDEDLEVDKYYQRDYSLYAVDLDFGPGLEESTPVGDNESGPDAMPLPA